MITWMHTLMKMNSINFILQAKLFLFCPNMESALSMERTRNITKREDTVSDVDRRSDLVGLSPNVRLLLL
jgi:hypothetical protein